MNHIEKPQRPRWGGLAVARDALSCWEHTPLSAPRHILFGENATWRIKTDSSVFALRIYRPGRWTDEQLEVEHRLMNLLGQKHGVMPPVAGKDGETLQFVPGTEYRAALFPWVPGRLFLGKPSVKQLRRLGSYLGRVHCYMLNSPPPESQRVWDEETLLWQPLQVARDTWPTLGLDEPFPEKILRLVDKFSGHWKRLSPLTALVHADLHLGNLKWSPNALFPIDFDDCGIAPLAYDLAVPASCFYGSKTEKDVLQHFLGGYEEAGPQPISLPELRLFMGIRKIWMFGWCAERPEVFSKPMLSSRYRAFTKQLDNFEDLGF